MNRRTFLAVSWLASSMSCFYHGEPTASSLLGGFWLKTVRIGPARHENTPCFVEKAWVPASKQGCRDPRFWPDCPLRSLHLIPTANELPIGRFRPDVEVLAMRAWYGILNGLTPLGQQILPLLDVGAVPLAATAHLAGRLDESVE